MRGVETSKLVSRGARRRRRRPLGVQPSSGNAHGLAGSVSEGWQRKWTRMLSWCLPVWKEVIPICSRSDWIERCSRWLCEGRTFVFSQHSRQFLFSSSVHSLSPKKRNKKIGLRLLLKGKLLRMVVVVGEGNFPWTGIDDPLEAQRS